jgi:hypothetical protein
LEESHQEGCEEHEDDDGGSSSDCTLVFLSPLFFCVLVRDKRKVVLYANKVSLLLFGYLFLHSLIYWFIYRLKPRCIYRMILVEDNFLDICSFIPQFIGLSIV